MSGQEDLELLRDAYAAWARGEFRRGDVWDPTVEFVTSGVEEPRTYVGPDGVREGWFDFLSAWNDFRVEAVEFLETAQDGTYVVLCHLRGRGKESDLPIEAETANTVTVREGKIVRFELFWDRSEALAAAGLAPGP